MSKKSTKGANNEKGFNKPPHDSLKYNDKIDIILFDAFIEKQNDRNRPIDQNNRNRPNDVFSILAYKNIINICIEKTSSPIDQS